MSFRKILVATDLSAESEPIFEPAIALAKAAKGQILLVSVVQEAVSLRMAVLANAAAVSPEIDRVAEGLVKRTRERLEELAEKMRREGIEVRVDSIEGLSPARTILDVAERENVDLIAIATHGRGGLKRLILGSVAERVVREAPCPVLVLRAKGAPTPPSRV